MARKAGKRCDLGAGAGDQRRCRGKAHRHIGAERSGDLRQPRHLVLTGLAAGHRGEAEPQRCGRIGRAAADAGGDRKALVEGQGEGREGSAERARERIECTQHEIVAGRLIPGGIGGESACEGTGERQRMICRGGRLCRQHVAEFGKGDKAVQQVIAVGAPAVTCRA